MVIKPLKNEKRRNYQFSQSKIHDRVHLDLEVRIVQILEIGMGIGDNAPENEK